jgi:hypothetical protein
MLWRTLRMRHASQTDKACKHLSAALERDPDCARVVKCGAHPTPHRTRLCRD